MGDSGRHLTRLGVSRSAVTSGDGASAFIGCRHPIGSNLNIITCNNINMLVIKVKAVMRFAVCSFWLPRCGILLAAHDAISWPKRIKILATLIRCMRLQWQICSSESAASAPQVVGPHW